MATPKLIRNLLNQTLIAYPQHTAKLPADMIAGMADVWQEHLGDLDDALLVAAVKNHIERSQWLPSIAEIRASAVSLMRQASPADQDWNEAYAELQRLVLAVGYTGKPEFTNPALAETVRTLGGWQQVCWNEDPEGVFRGQFRDVYQVVIGRMERKVQQSSTVREFIAAMTPQENRLLPEPGEAQDIIRRLADGKRP
jgi:hypothetical protein